MKTEIKDLRLLASSWDRYCVRVGDIGYFGNSLAQLQIAINKGYKHQLIGIQTSVNTNVQNVFVADNGQSYGLYIEENLWPPEDLASAEEYVDESL